MNDVTISIVSHGHGELLARLLHELDACSPPGDSYRVVLTLNLGDEPFDPAAYARLRLTVIRNPAPQGFGANHNAAFRRCETRWFAVLNPDLRLVGGDPFPALAAAHRAGGRIGVVAPRIVGPSGRPEDAVRANLTPWSLVLRSVLGRRETSAMPDTVRRGAAFRWLAGMFLMLDADAFRRVGGFDERYFLYCEDYDLCARLYLAGYGIVSTPSAAVMHDARRDSHRSRRHLQWHVAGLLKVWTSAAFWKVVFASAGDRRSPV